MVTRDRTYWLRTIGSKLFVWATLALLVVWTIGPLAMTLSISFKTPGEVISDPGFLPNAPTLEAYKTVLGRPEFRVALLNSVIVGVGTCLLTMLLGVPAAYAFARFRFRGRHLLLLFTLLPRLVPGVGVMLPLYLLAAKLGVLDNRLTLIVVYSGMLLPLSVWLLVGFFQQVPREIEESASVDGASTWQRIRHIVLPLALPAVVTITILAFREAWNEFQLVLVLTTSPDKRTLPYELFRLLDWGGIANHPREAAFALLTVAPLMFLFIRIERYVVQGLTSGALK